MLTTLQRPVGARTLYLAHGERKRASVTDDSLVITNQQLQRQRIPLQRVARIVSSTSIDWSGTALQACQMQAIAITWIDPHGHALGTLCPHHRSTSSMAVALDLLLETPEGLQRYRHWQRGRRMAVLNTWRATCAPTPQPQEWEQIKRDWVYAGQHPQHLPIDLQAQCLALVAQQMALEHIPFDCFGPHAEPIALDHALCDLLWGEMNLQSGSLASQPADHATGTLLFERWQQRNAAALLVHIRSLNLLAHKALRPEPVQ